MIGAQVGSKNAQASVIRGRPLAAAAPVPASDYGRGHASAVYSDNEDSAHLTPWVVVSLLVLWLLWAVVDRHQKIKAQVQPKNVAVNIRNLWAIVLPVILAYAVLRIALVKLNVWFAHVPYVGPFLKALIKVVN